MPVLAVVVVEVVDGVAVDVGVLVVLLVAVEVLVVDAAGTVLEALMLPAMLTLWVVLLPMLMAPA